MYYFQLIFPDVYLELGCESLVEAAALVIAFNKGREFEKGSEIPVPHSSLINKKPKGEPKIIHLP